MRTRPIFFGIFLLAASVLLFEIALTRVFAIIMWHHFTYMVVSMALLGFGAAGSILTAKKAALAADDPAPALAKLTLAYGAAVMFATCSVTLVRIDSLEIWKDPSNLVALLLIYLIISVPFVLGGAAIGLALSRFPHVVGKLYFFDLIGSALGGAVSVLLLARFGGLATVIAAGAFGVAAGCLFAFAAPFRYRVLAVALLIPAGWLAISFAGGSTALRIPKSSWRVPFAPGKEIGQSADGMPETVLTSATAEVEITKSRSTAPMIGGNFGRVDARGVTARYVAQDGTAPTMLYENAAKLELFPFLDDSQAGSAYVTLKARGGAAPDVLVIGVGGGVDVMVALANGAKSVTAVEINSAMIRMVTETFADYTGGLFKAGAHPHADRIRLVHEEGRSFMRRQQAKYDIIQMSGVDSFTALSTGAYTLSESYLYTKEAVREFYEHLNDGGYVNYSRFIVNRPKLPRETLRLANIAREALADMGIADPAAQIAVFQGIDWASTIIKKGPFTAAEIAALEAFARAEDFKGLVFDPLHPVGKPFTASAQSLVMAESYFTQAVEAKKELLAGATVDPKALVRGTVEAFRRLYEGDERGADQVLVQTLELLPEAKRQPLRDALWGLLGGAVVKAREASDGFQATRADFAAVLRSAPADRERWLRDYPYDLTASTDDKPFFFNYYKYSGLWSRGASKGGPESESQKRYHPDFPVGHAILLASLVQIAVLAAALIILPLRRLAEDGVPTPGKWRYLLYFAALGLGFMLVEIVLMQRLVLFLGHPTYAVSVVLTSILAAAGIGALSTGRIARVGGAQLVMILLLIVAVILGEAWATRHLLPRLLGLELEARIAATVALLFPLGFVLGLAFPCGIRVLKSNCPQLLPWGWAVNGLFSVFASLFCIVLSMQIGFSNVLYVAAGIYALGFLFMKPEEKARPGAREGGGADLPLET